MRQSTSAARVEVPAGSPRNSSTGTGHACTPGRSCYPEPRSTRRIRLAAAIAGAPAMASALWRLECLNPWFSEQFWPELYREVAHYTRAAEESWTG